MLNYFPKIVGFLVVAVLAIYVHGQEPATKNAGAAQKLTAKDFRKALFAKATEVVVMSHDGVYFGMDNDREFTLREDGSVTIMDCGFALTKTVGKYEITDSGTIIIKPNGEPAWLPMPWAIDKDLLVIKPPAKEAFFEAARKFGIPEIQLTEEAYKESYEQWPLRQITDPKHNQIKR